MTNKVHFDRVIDEGFRRLAELRREPDANKRLAIGSTSAKRALDTSSYIIASTIESASKGASAAVEAVEPLRQLWRGGSFDKALDITLTFALPTLSWVLNRLASETTAPRESVLVELGKRSPQLVDTLTWCLISESAMEDTLQTYTECETQLRYEYWQLGGVDWSVLAVIVLADAIDALGGDPPLRGPLGELPVTSFLEFMIRPCVRDRQMLADQTLALQVKQVLDFTFDFASASFSEAAQLRFTV